MISCSHSKKETCPVASARDFCIVSGRFEASQEDKQALKQSKVSKEFVKQFIDHNDLWDDTCKSQLPTTATNNQDPSKQANQ